MTRDPHVLLLAGAGETAAIARGLARMPHVQVTASVLPSARNRVPLPVPERIGGFGGEDGFRRYLHDHQITAVLDVTHSFAARISDRAARVCADLSLPYAQVLRPPWTAGEGDRWTHVADAAGACAHFPATARVFSTAGRDSLAQMQPPPRGHIFVRQNRPGDPGENTDHITFVPSNPPFSVKEELELFENLKIDLLLVKNSGGASGASKLLAARQMVLPVILIDRPAQPDGPKLADVQTALDWVAAL